MAVWDQYSRTACYRSPRTFGTLIRGRLVAIMHIYLYPSIQSSILWIVHLISRQTRGSVHGYLPRQPYGLIPAHT